MVVAFDWTDLGYRRYQSPGITDGAKCDGFYEALLMLPWVYL
jgi:hypothetical protein